MNHEELLAKMAELEARVKALEEAKRIDKCTTECNDLGPCKRDGECNGCVYAHTLGEPPCSNHTYSGCSG